MPIRTPADLGAVIRERRKKLKLDQADLAARIGASRQWVIGVEKGRSRAEIGLLLRALNALGLHLDTFLPSPNLKKISEPDIDAIVTKAKKGTR